jgi:hypothetical protein
MRMAVLLALLVSLAVVSAGCGGDDEPEATSTTEWADGFCTAVTAWRDELERIGDELMDLSTFSTEALEEAVQDASDATDEFVDDVRNLGELETESGEAVDDALQELSDTVEAEKDEIETEVEGISGITEIAAAGTRIASSVAAMFTALEQAFAAIDAADMRNEIETAFEQSESCDEVRGSG